MLLQELIAAEDIRRSIVSTVDPHRIVARLEIEVDAHGKQRVLPIVPASQQRLG
jgi:hypothetical protein